MSGTRSRWRRAGAAAVLLATMAAGSCAPPAPTIGGDFTLTDHTGARFELQSQRGKLLLVFFGYTMCPDVCPTTLSKLSAVMRRLGDANGEVRTLYVSVDPERDTPEVLKADLALFQLDAVGLTGTRAEVDEVVKLFGASYEIVPTPESAGRYSVSHSTTLYLLDREGRVRQTFPYEATVDEIAAGIESLLGRPAVRR
ncbi:MAG: SCO family protein [Gemmatimonadetes bacterium]|jgi:protein SCO1/2|nr:SCO family protein [Gemmatimonadota bacterium]MBP7549668.1 SCO family protein [Gemmatimonadaceae bacterium]